MELSALWSSVMFRYLYGIFFGFFKPGKLQSMIAGRTPVGPTSKGVLFGMAALMAIPGAMVFLSLILPLA